METEHTQSTAYVTFQYMGDTAQHSSCVHEEEVALAPMRNEGTNRQSPLTDVRRETQWRRRGWEKSSLDLGLHSSPLLGVRPHTPH